MAEAIQSGCEKAVAEHQQTEDTNEVKAAGRPKGKQGTRTLNARKRRCILHAHVRRNCEATSVLANVTHFHRRSALQAVTGCRSQRDGDVEVGARVGSHRRPRAQGGQATQEMDHRILRQGQLQLGLRVGQRGRQT